MLYNRLKFNHSCALCRQPADTTLLCVCCQARWLENYLIDWQHPHCLRCERHSVAPFASQLGHALKRLKYQRQLYWLRPIHWLLKQWLQEFSPKAATVIPMPLHPWRRWHRGFNQCELIAEAMTPPTWMIDSQSIRRQKHTTALEGLSKQQRQQQMHLAFDNRSSLIGQSILLLDDVYTTGASMEALIRCCQRAGAGSISILTLCHTQSKERQSNITPW